MILPINSQQPLHQINLSDIIYFPPKSPSLVHDSSFHHSPQPTTEEITIHTPHPSATGVVFLDIGLLR
jgi:hypothetical protein